MYSREELNILIRLDNLIIEAQAYKTHVEKLIVALEKIADPRKRDHKEPDLYTENACLMNIADEALKEFYKVYG